MLSLVCNESLDLTGKRTLMFSYGSGCAASMFILRFNSGYKNIQRIAQFKERLAARVKVSPEDYDREMSKREAAYGKGDFVPEGSIDHIENGTYYLTNCDKSYIRSYAIKTSDSKPTDAGSANPSLPKIIASQTQVDRLTTLNKQFAPMVKKMR